MIEEKNKTIVTTYELKEMINLFISKREKQTKNRIKNIVENKLKEKLWSESAEISLNLSLEKVVLGDLSPYQIAKNIIDNFVSHKK